MGRCYFCGKGPVSGHRISHSHRVTGRWFHPNLQKVRAIIDGKVKRIWVCTKCLKSGKVQRPPLK